MELQAGIFPIHPADFLRVLEVWEASFRATHRLLTEADIQFFKPLVRNGLPHMAELAGARDGSGQIVGFVSVAGDKVEMLFIHPAWRGRGIGRRLLTDAILRLGATYVDVNEQNEEAVGFYRRIGFEVIGRSARDDTGKPFPLLHMQFPSAARERIS